jgi:hypothetical protein
MDASMDTSTDVNSQRYEIFQKHSTKHATWVETATGLKNAKLRLRELTEMFPGDYFIFDSGNSCFIIPFDAADKEAPISDCLEVRGCATAGAGGRRATTRPSGGRRHRNVRTDPGHPALGRYRGPDFNR